MVVSIGTVLVLLLGYVDLTLGFPAYFSRGRDVDFLDPPTLLERRQFSNETGCTRPAIRKSWHTLTDIEKHSYISAERCLMYNTQARTNLPGAVSRFDDLVKVHQVQAAIIHHTGLFLPFHRLFTWAHEHLLRTECHYNGTQPYWDEPLDAGSFSTSPVLSPETGFGGTGTAPSYCLTEGPFANHTLHAGPGWGNVDHCLAREVNDTASALSSRENVERCLGMEGYREAALCIEDRPHRGGHAGIGREMNDAITSPGDPLFYLHHAFIDKIWWEWQRMDPENRTYVTSGFTTATEPRDGWEEVTLEYSLQMLDIVPSALIREVVDTHGPLFCYDYE